MSGPIVRSPGTISSRPPAPSVRISADALHVKVVFVRETATTARLQ